MTKHIPMTVRARQVMEAAGGINHINADLLCEKLGIKKQTAWALMYQLKHNPTAGKVQRGPKTTERRTFIHRASAAGRMLRAMDSESAEEKAFLATIQLIGVARAEELLADFRSRLIKDIKGVGE